MENTLKRALHSVGLKMVERVDVKRKEEKACAKFWSLLSNRDFCLLVSQLWHHITQLIDETKIGVIFLLFGAVQKSRIH